MKAEILQKATELVNFLKTKNLKIATAESCTGGMVSSYITAVPGASQVLELGVTSYSNRIKNEVLQVDAKTLSTLGAVSAETAAQMAQNIRLLACADLGISVTGVAGPAAQDGYPAGVVFIGVSTKDGTYTQKLEIEPRDRNFVREQATGLLLEAALKSVK